jgi:hypothetical protein
MSVIIAYLEIGTNHSSLITLNKKKIKSFHSFIFNSLE